MEYLLDTHTLLWYATNDRRLPEKQYKEIESLQNKIFVSHVTIWEIGIKSAIGKLKIENTVEYFVRENIEAYNFIFLPIDLQYIIKATSLPQHHRDPFDRLLISQSMIENIPIISSDSTFDQYGISRIW